MHLSQLLEGRLQLRIVAESRDSQLHESVRSRPLLVKFASVWDRKLLLSSNTEKTGWLF